MNDKLFYEEVADGTEHVSSGRTVTEAENPNEILVKIKGSL